MFSPKSATEETPLKEIPAAEGWDELRWVPFVASMALMFVAGSSYGVGLYDADLKARFFNDTYGQTQIENLIFYANLGQWFPIGGYFLDSTFGGLHNTALIGAGLLFAGYSGIAAWSANLLTLSYTGVAVFWFTYGLGCEMCDVTAVTCTAWNFPNQRGTALGLLKAVLGLSSAILSEIYAIFFPGKTTGYLLFLATFQPCVVLLLYKYIKRVPVEAHKDADDPDERLGYGIKLVLALAALVLLVSGLKQVPGIRTGVLSWILLSAAILTAGAMMLLTRGRGHSRDEGQQHYKARFPGPVDCKTLAEAVRMPEFTLLFLTGLCCTGSGLTLSNNVAQMVSSAGGSTQAEAVLVAVISSMGSIGRIVFGLIPDMMHESISRQSFLMINCALATLGHIIMSTGTMYTLFTGAMLVSLCYGGYFSLIPALIIEYFGLGNFASISASIVMSTCVSSFCFSMHLAGYLYDLEAVDEGSTDGTCTGPQCWRNLFYCLALLTSIGMGLGAAQLALVRHKEKSHV